MNHTMTRISTLTFGRKLTMPAEGTMLPIRRKVVWE